ncbi:MAG: hypothetical protein JO027_10180 [Solirubrobacterales bacterium]|nr:hypothetical protein [Solirubrobacterales bacterium]
MTTALALSLSLATLGLLASSAFADAGIALDKTTTYLNAEHSQAWTTLMGGVNGQMHWVRFFVTWDVAGTQSGGKCVAYLPGNSGGPGGSQSLHDLLQAMSDAEHAGLTPLLAIAKGNPYAEEPGDPAAPTSGQYSCGFSELLSALTTPASFGFSQFSDVIASHGYFETFNEPDNSVGDTTCGTGVKSYVCAADYYVDAYNAVKAAGQLSGDVLIAGTFSTASDASDDPSGNGGATTAGKGCNNVSPFVQPSGGWDWKYACALGALAGQSGFAVPTNWSFHDYNDNLNGHPCPWINASPGQCVTEDAKNMQSLVKGFTANPVIWLTEAGAWLPGKSTVCSDCLNGNVANQAGATEDWLTLEQSSLVQHAFWYEFETFGDGYPMHGSDTFDSALLGINRPYYPEDGLLAPGGPAGWGQSDNGAGVPRVAYCILAFNETSAAAEADSRCDYSKTPTLQTTTNWEYGPIFGPIAFSNSANHNLYTIDSSGHESEWQPSQGYPAIYGATSPSVTTLNNGTGYIAAYQATGNYLYTVGLGQATTNWGATMDPNSSPSISFLGTGHTNWVLAYQSGSHGLYTLEPGQAATYWSQMAPGTSPSITSFGTNYGNWVVAYADGSGYLNTLQPGSAATNWGARLASNTSPSVTFLADGNWEAAYVDGSNDLETLEPGHAAHNWGVQVAPGSSPSITSVGSGWVAAFETPNDTLATLDSATGTVTTHSNIPMEAGASPDISAVNGGWWRVAFPTERSAFATMDMDGLETDWDGFSLFMTAQSGASVADQ